MTKGSYPHYKLNNHGKTDCTLDVDVELSKKFKFPERTSLDITRSKCMMACLWPGISWCICNAPSTQTWDRLSLTMKRMTSSHSLPRLTAQTLRRSEKLKITFWSLLQVIFHLCTGNRTLGLKRHFLVI